ncbi:hypothetical protein FD723_40925 (plasmid) [Nostoc sp. C052]|nr:hypothetical protein FD723_40925 [Nostoc sp. C052]
MVQLCNQMEIVTFSTNLAKLRVVATPPFLRKGMEIVTFSTNLVKLRVVARRFLYYAATSLFHVYPEIIAAFATRTKNLTTNFHILKQLNLITNYRQLFTTMKANLKHDQTLIIKKTKNNIKRNSSNATVFLLVQEYCRLSKLLDPSESDIEGISAILELAQYDSELNCLINEADHLIAYELGFSEEFEEFYPNFRVSEQEKEPYLQ